MSVLGSEQFAWAARQLGLTLTETTGALQFGRLLLEGTVDGQPISIRQWRGDYVWVDFDALFEPQADLHVWFQCKDGDWNRGVKGSQGPFGACEGT